ncbi:MAG: ATP-dependent Clp protease ATP-binding subunit [Deltaproteobacteria bacterium]|nr:ATP-dependent Clp protease ATP-binding subunit [Deltaproteobacteria bacterium]
MEKKFQLFVRRHLGGGVTAQVLARPHLASFAEDLGSARADLSLALERLLARDDQGLTRETTFWPGLELRRVDLVLRAKQHRRLLPVPMRFTVLLRPTGPEAKRPKGEALTGPVLVTVPRLGLEQHLEELADLDAFLEEHLRHALFMCAFSRLRDVAYEGAESVESLLVSYRPARKPDARVGAGREADPSGKATHRLRMLPPGLSEACRWLDDEASAGLLDRAFQRERELAQVVDLITHARRASVLLVGPSGVGKTALVHELAHRIAHAEEGSPLRGMELFSTSGARIVAGMRYLGEWQARMQGMTQALRARRAALHLESLTEFLASFGAAMGLDGASWLQPLVASGELCLLVETTAEDLGRAERSHPGLVQALRALVLQPFTADAAWQCLQASSQRIARAHKVRFHESALWTAVDLCERFQPDGAMPGAALGLLRSAAAEEASQEGAGSKASPRVLRSDATLRAFTRRTGYPRTLLDPSIPLDPDAVLTALRERVLGQDEALTLLRDLVVTLKSALGDPRKPLGSFLFLGPTGVGKTESALALTHWLFGDERKLVRLDMAEYAAPGSASRLVGLYGNEGLLCRRVREEPYGVVLLDEVEKADQGVHDLLLQVLGEGRLTDATGRTVSFCNTVVVLTSNLGAEGEGRAFGFGERTERSLDQHYRAAAGAFFRPEFLNRLDHLVPFRPLGTDTVRAITRRALTQALAREGVQRRGVTVTFDEPVVDALAAQGMDPRYGARPLKRVIEQRVIAPLAWALTAASDAPRAYRVVVTDAGVAVRVVAEG